MRGVQRAGAEVSGGAGVRLSLGGGLVGPCLGGGEGGGAVGARGPLRGKEPRFGRKNKKSKNRKKRRKSTSKD